MRSEKSIWMTFCLHVADALVCVMLEVRSVWWWRWLRVAFGLEASLMGIGNRCITVQRVARWQVMDVRLCCAVEESFWLGAPPTGAVGGAGLWGFRRW